MGHVDETNRPRGKKGTARREPFSWSLTRDGDDHLVLSDAFDRVTSVYIRARFGYESFAL